VANYRVSTEYEKQTIIQHTKQNTHKEDKKNNQTKKNKDKAANPNANTMTIPLK
jgi:hypothetical protein